MGQKLRCWPELQSSVGSTGESLLPRSLILLLEGSGLLDIGQGHDLLAAWALPWASHYMATCFPQNEGSEEYSWANKTQDTVFL